MSHIDEFRAAISSAGLVPPDHILDDGKRHRFASNGRPRDDSGWYVLYGDERPAGAFGCWRAQVSETWKSGEQREFTDAERAEWRARMERLATERLAEEQQRRETARSSAFELWARGTPANGHPYLERKGIAGAVASASARELDGILLVPVKHGPRDLVGLQRIDADGDKRFLPGTPAGGGYTTIGSPASGGPVAIVEGYATGMSVHLATGFCVVVAFNAGNLEPVAKKIRAALPQAELVIAGDDDAFTTGNPGRTAATRAAEAVGGRTVFPVWVDSERGRGTDFNDLHQAEGLDAVAQCFGEPDGPPDPPPAAIVETGAPPAHRPAVDYLAPLPNSTDRGRPLGTIDNVAEITRRLGVTIRYNVISKEEEILIPGMGFSMDNRANASLAWLTSEAAKFRLPIGNIGDFVTFLSDCNLYNPVAQWIESKPWDGVDRLSQLIATVRAKDEDVRETVPIMKRAFLIRWMISAVAAAFRPAGVSAHGVLVFQGDQYIGKTKWFKTLVPSELGVLQDGVILRPDDRDSVKQCVSNWLVELGELDATFRKSDIAALKAFLTRDRDVLRRAFARKESEFARRTVFFASVNPKEFLHDPTGNRRYWTIECESLDHSHNIDMQQCWRQVYELWRGGEEWYLNGDEMAALNAHNEDFEVVDPIEEQIRSGLNWKAAEGDWTWRSATDVLISLGRDKPTMAEATRAAHVLRNLNGKRSRRSSGGRQVLAPPEWGGRRA